MINIYICMYIILKLNTKFFGSKFTKIFKWIQKTEGPVYLGYNYLKISFLAKLHLILKLLTIVKPINIIVNNGFFTNLSYTYIINLLFS